MSSVYVQDRAGELISEMRKIIKYEYDDNPCLLEKLDDLRTGMGLYRYWSEDEYRNSIGGSENLTEVLLWIQRSNMARVTKILR